MRLVYAAVVVLALAACAKEKDNDTNCSESIARFEWDFGSGGVKSEAFECVEASGVECTYIRQISGAAFETDCAGDVILR